MKLSVICGTNRSSLVAWSRLVNVCSFGGDDVQVIIRDNSGDPAKREFLSRIPCRNCQIILVDPCKAWENGLAITLLAQGDFVLSVADDDDSNDLAIRDICRRIDEVGGDPSVVGVTGKFLLETDTQSAIFRYDGADRASGAERMLGYLRSGGPNILQYSAIRRDALHAVSRLLQRLPYRFSYTDQLQSLLYLASGRFEYIERVMYRYDISSNWGGPDAALNSDLRYYLEAEVDPSAVRLHWLMCAFEGAKAVLSKYDGAPGLPADQRAEMARLWFQSRYRLFQALNDRSAPGARFEAHARKLAAKWMDIKTIDMNMLLEDLSEYFALHSPEAGQRYNEFWR